MDAKSAQIREQALRYSSYDAISLLHGNIFTGLLMTFLAMSCLVFGFDNPEVYPLKLYFWIATVVVVVLRLADTLYWRISLRGTSYNPDIPLLRFSLGAIATIIIWATYVSVLYYHLDTLEMMSTLVILSAIAGGAATILAPSRLLVSLYCTLLILPVSVLAITDIRNEFNIIGFLGIGYWLVLLAISLKSNSFFSNAIDIKRVNESLISELKTERNQAAKANEALRITNEKLDNSNATLEEAVMRRTDDIHRLSNRDPLTELLNRAGFNRHLESVLKTTRELNNSLAVLFVDLDGFKQVNDGLGHQIGDKVLVEVAKRLARFCEPDHIARWGGDEFVIALPYATRDTAIAVAQAARSGITIPIIVEENQILLDATIGIAIFPEHGDTASLLIQEADVTMYEQKRIQPGTVGVFNAKIYNSIKEEQALRSGLRHAIERGEFSVVYQPIINGSDNSVWAAEALIRWTFNDTPVRPDIFIPIAEKIGLIHEIGDWVLNRACIDAAQWVMENEVAVSVNVSVMQLMDDNFTGALDRALKSSGLAPERLHLEITESVFADNKEKIQMQINAIKSRNIHISIDDFGTGFSSLSQLQTLNFDTIKIDRAFVQNLEEGSDTIIGATLLIAKEFGYKTVAEGIETLEHAERLTRMGVDCLQGYYYARPLPIRDLAKWFEQHQQ
ncbi:putative bifunctional diguanylate cyclase/phosphodiesterase [Alteromonas sp. ASW11-130]|uniref:putative bifunctional diguanylate cyclase/phosphodiesterase n=1 Tax=Alteromonas sp. ASW11-130 TaxID=3015775 RepID=UPI002241887D|nr:EAL domain-containing protein [Alteromonas sp. ASW11-130]MCW8091246.1 EAL domain-containing protein [Alteromonas sp. ASW11-130]